MYFSCIQYIKIRELNLKCVTNTLRRAHITTLLMVCCFFHVRLFCCVFFFIDRLLVTFVIELAQFELISDGLRGATGRQKFFFMFGRLAIFLWLHLRVDWITAISCECGGQKKPEFYIFLWSRWSQMDRNSINWYYSLKIFCLFYLKNI